MKTFMKTNGKKDTFMTVLATRCRKHLPTIEEDVGLIRQFLSCYEKRRTS